MTTTEVIEFLKKLNNQKGIYLIPLSAFIINFKDETKESIVSELTRMTKKELIIRVSPGLFLNPFYKADKETVLTQIAKKLRPYDQMYLSLDARAFELGMIQQVPNRLTFVTDGRSYVYDTPVGTLEFNHQNIEDIRKNKGVKYDRNRGIYVANRKKVIMDAKKHKRIYLLDLIAEQEERNDQIEL